MAPGTATSSEKVVVITGASAGVGRASAIAFARRGWRVALIARGMEGLLGAEHQVRAAGGTPFVAQADVADAEEVEAVAERIERECGPIAVWVNNAMATLFSPVAQTSPQEFSRATEVTYLGAVWGTQAALKRMRQRDAGTIVQVGSALAYRSIPLQAAYCGAKSALRGFTDSLRSELIHDGSRVHLTMVHLSAFNTPQFDWGRNRMGRFAKPLGKIFQPEIAGEAIYWSAQQRRREVWVGYPAVQAIVGTKVIPGFLDRYLAYRAYDGQLADTPLPPDYRDNLFTPVPGNPGAQGRFSSSALHRSFQFWLTSHRWILATAAILALIALGLILGLAR